MTDRIDHRAAAERMLADADEWTAQAGEPTPAAGELSSLAWAAVHALLAIHDTLTAADRYAANEAKQREAGDADGAPSAAAPVDDDPAGDAVDGEEGERRYLNAQTRRYIAFAPRNPKPGDEVDIYELGEPEPRWVPGWIAKRNERNGRIADRHHMEACLHEWAEDTRTGDTTRHFICTECGITRTEERQ